MDKKRLSRRNFMKTASASAAAAGAASSVFGASPPRVLGANERIKIGIIGPGGRVAGYRDDMLEGVHLSSVTVNLIFSSPHIAPSPSPSLFARQSGFPEIPRALVVLHGFRGFFRIHVGDLVSGELHRLELQPRIQIEVVRLTDDEVQ